MSAAVSLFCSCTLILFKKRTYRCMGSKLGGIDTLKNQNFSIYLTWFSRDLDFQKPEIWGDPYGNLSSEHTNRYPRCFSIKQNKPDISTTFQKNARALTTRTVIRLIFQQKNVLLALHTYPSHLNVGFQLY